MKRKFVFNLLITINYILQQNDLKYEYATTKTELPKRKV